jgi:hypothetical protein
MEKFGSGINIPDPQHCMYVGLTYNTERTFEQGATYPDERAVSCFTDIDVRYLNNKILFCFCFAL